MEDAEKDQEQQRREAIRELIAGLGVNQRLLILTRKEDSFVRFDAMPGGRIWMRLGAPRPDVEVEMTRDQIEYVIADFGLSELLDAELRYVLQDAAGQLMADGEPAPVLESDADGLAERSQIPLSERVRLFMQQFHLGNITLGQPGEFFVVGLGDVFVRVLPKESEELLEITSIIELPDNDESRARYVSAVEKVSGLVQVQVERDEARPDMVSVIAIVHLPASPFVGQHLSRAIYETLDFVTNLTNHAEEQK